ncbi:conserved unknown protein [Ectocarpus siliculosus]|uniref:Gamma-glutamylcyclotransferase n=1 Tax=Ectocarpus siliculosus TaxID=2880 RepID=D8LT36_ECTSI|nr:conserved unknown protein [Ectocarpus siliculosus]|eukprot:CBN75310.1 conserved unknown protein [Ectocarpus siliculosus]
MPLTSRRAPILALLYHAAHSGHRIEAFVHAAATRRCCWHRLGGVHQQACHHQQAFHLPSILQLMSVGGRDETLKAAPSTAMTMGADVAKASAAIKAAPTESSRSGGILGPLKESIRNDRGRSEDCDAALLYFSFGANMCPSILTSKRGVNPFASLPAEATQFSTGTRRNPSATDGAGGVTRRDKTDTQKSRGMCVCFCHRAGYATLARNPGPPQSWEKSPGAHGVLHVISPSSLEKIAASENGYEKRLVDVATPTGDRDIAVCFVSNPWQTLPTSVPPTSRYLSLLQDGAAYHNVDERYRAWLALLPSVRPEDEMMSSDRVRTPSKIVTDTVLAVAAFAAFVAAGAAINPF